MKQITGIIITLVIISCKSFAQHIPLYSQYMFNGLVINPAYALGDDGLSGVVYYKKQWSGIEGAPSTFSSTLQSSFKQEQLNVGFIFLHDEYGLKTQNDAAANFAYRLNTGKGKLGMGLSGGISVIYYNLNKLRTVDQNDPTFSELSAHEVMPKIGMGFYYHSEKFFTGLSIPQWLIGNTNENIPGIFRRTIMGYTGYSIGISNNIQLTPSLLLRKIAGTSIQVDYNFLVTFQKFLSAGVSYRMYNSLIFLAQYRWGKFALGYAYDLATGPLSGYTSGSHELMLRYNITYGVNMPDPKRF